MIQTINRQAELAFLLACIREYEISPDVNEWEEAAGHHIRALWTAYCLHHDLDPDTASYDQDLRQLWQTIEGSEKLSDSEALFNAFDLHMGEYLS